MVNVASIRKLESGEYRVTLDPPVGDANASVFVKLHLDPSVVWDHDHTFTDRFDEGTGQPATAKRGDAVGSVTHQLSGNPVFNAPAGTTKLEFSDGTTLDITEA